MKQVAITYFLLVAKIIAITLQTNYNRNYHEKNLLGFAMHLSYYL